jgi:hypothetical protein
LSFSHIPYWENVSADCNHALQQIRDYRRWLRDNALFEEKQGFKGLNADCEGWVVIGRRDADRTELEQQRFADFRKERIAALISGTGPFASREQRMGKSMERG